MEKATARKGTSLEFVNRLMDQHIDFQDIIVLTLSNGLVDKGKSIQIKVVGDAKDEYS